MKPLKFAGIVTILTLILGVLVATSSTIVTPVTETTNLSGLCTGSATITQIASIVPITGTCSQTITYTSLSTSIFNTGSSSTSSTTSTAFTGGNGLYYSGAKVPQTPNSGVFGLIDVEHQTFGGCLSFWVADNSLSSGYWAQVGYYICGNSSPTGFYQIWNLNAYQVITAGSIPSLAGGQHNFSMYVTTGTTWAFAIDGVQFGTYNMGSVTPGSYEPVFAIAEQSGVASPNDFSSITFKSAINLNINGAWAPASAASAYVWGSSSDQMDVAGTAQISTLSSNQLQVGFGFSTAENGQTLW